MTRGARYPRAGVEYDEVWCPVERVWLPGPWRVRIVFSALSGPAFMLEVEHTETGIVRGGKVFV